MLTRSELEQTIRLLLRRYHASSALLFGSYSRGNASPDSDVDVIVFGGDAFKKTNVFAFAEDLRDLTGKSVDAFEISEVNVGTPFYETVLREGVRIA